MIKLSSLKCIALLTACVLAGGCATNRAELSDPVNDPWEPYNRKMYRFNDAIDRAVLAPVARGYKKVTPDPVEKGVSNFVSNLTYPVTVINLALQGKMADSGKHLTRFLVNSTFGVLGIFDVAGPSGVPAVQEDFGQTLAVWGYEDSRYFILPLFGPSTVRDTFGRVVDRSVDPISYLSTEEDIYWPRVLSVIDLRAGLLETTDSLEDSYDPYLLMRDGYLQNREFRIYDGEPPLPDYESFLDEEWEEEAID